MFRFHKSLDVVTLFHRPSISASSRVLNVLKQASSNAGETATEDQASSHSAQLKASQQAFELNVTEDPPTTDQLKTILEYVGAKRAGEVVEGARNEAEAMKKLKENSENFKRPVTVDWNNGRAVIGDNVSEILKMVETLPKS